MKKFPIYINNPDGLTRVNEPIEVDLLFSTKVKKSSLVLVNGKGIKVPFQLYDVVERGDFISKATLVFIEALNKINETYYLIVDEKNRDNSAVSGIITEEAELTDGFCRLNTGYYRLELCSGKADGTAAGKWGIRYFENLVEEKNLIKDCSNSIGGFYGPFFTPSNGLINPPEHTKVVIMAEEIGPLYHRYRFKGKIPNGIDEKLKDKKFEIVWEFFYNSPIIRRCYFVDEFETFVDGVPVKNKITVGDEFESGQGEVVFNKFAAYGSTTYRAGDLYANILADNVREILKGDIDEDHLDLLKYRNEIGANINEVSWDYFWKMFCSEESLLSKAEIISHVKKIIPTAHQLTHRGQRNNHIQSLLAVEVNEAPEQTIFPMSANKTCESNDQTGYSMVWVTDAMVNRYQIVQRKDSGWVNWGTNGENEYPELPIGTVIKTAYGKFNNWEAVADSLEKPIVATLGIMEEDR